MNEKEYIREIRRFFSYLPPEELQDMIGDYQEHFRSGAAAGRTEEEIAEKLGAPRILARQHRAASRVDAAQACPTAQNTARAILAVLALDFFNLFVLLVPVIILFSLLLSGMLVGAVLAVTGAVLAGAALFFLGGLLSVSAALGAVALGAFGVVLFLLTLWGLRGSARLVLVYLKKNVEIIRGKEAAHA